MKTINNKYLLVILVATAYFVTARLGLTLAYQGTNATPIWLPTGIALSAVLLLGNRMWPGIALGAFIANFLQLTELGLSISASFAASLGAAAGNTLEALIGAYLVHRFTGTRNPFGRSSDVFAFIIFGALISTTISATIGTATFCLSVSEWTNSLSIWLTWWMGDAAGAIIMVPLVMTFKGFDAAGWKKLRPMAVKLLIWALIGAVCYSMFFRSIPLNFILFPVLIIAAFRLGQFGSAMAIGVISIVSTYATVNGTGPFSAMTLTEALLLQQVFIGSIATASMVLSTIVSEQNKTELKLSESEKRSRMLIEQAPIGIALSREGITLNANTAYLSMFGFSDISELRGTHLTDRIAPQKRAEMFDHISRHAQGLTISAAYETVGLRKDGSQFPFYVSLNRIVLADGPLTVSFHIDITERKRAEETLQDNERKYRELVMNANSIILRMDNDGKVTFMNEYGLKFFGYSEAEILGRHVIGTIVPETESSGRDLRLMMDRICADPAGFEQNINENMRKNGAHVWINWTNKFVLDEQGQVKEILSIGSDITGRKHAEEELNKHREHLEQLVLERTADLQKSRLALTNIVEDLNLKKEELAGANDRLKELDKLKSMFIASMSHELRTPLNSIIGFTGMTLQGLSGELNDEQKDNLSRSYQSAKHLLSLITDIIDISKIESGRIDAFPEPVLLNELISEAISVVKPQLKEKALALNVDAPAEVRLNTDKKRLLQCLLNFLSNAIKYTEAGTITLTAGESDGNLELTVSDTGIGIAEKDMPKLFEAFERLDTHLRIKAGGTGLGLYLTKKIVTEILHGEISVQSREGRGSSFTLSVPKDIIKSQGSSASKGDLQ
jgi:PAS domain S-box-containing protein